MKNERIHRWTLILLMLTWLPALQVRADGGYFSSRSVAVSADQRAIIIKNGNEISMTFSTGYTGEGEDFGWIIPTPVPPAIKDVSEAGENGEAAFQILDRQSAPVFSTYKSGCFPYGPEVLDTYIDQKWAFVAVKYNPSEKRHYENEFLPPLTIKYQSDRLIYPLRISSVSTAQTAKITLYVIAESTVTSSTLPTTTLRFDDNLAKGVDPESCVEVCIQRTLRGSDGHGLVVIWSGEFAQSADQRKIIDGLMKTPFPEDKKSYLTRLDTMMSPASMTEDIKLMLDSQPKYFQVQISAEAGYDCHVSN